MTDYICWVPIAVSLLFPAIYGFNEGDILGVGILAIATVVVLLKHVENIQHIREGREMKLSFLWKPAEELERIKQYLPEDEIQMHQNQGFKSLTDKK